MSTRAMKTPCMDNVAKCAISPWAVPEAPA
jgi:hypothetical protein